MFPAVLLSCSSSHPPASLIVVADRREGERVVSGTLGCVVCGAEYLLCDGIAYIKAAGSAAPDTEAAVRGQGNGASMSATIVDPMRVAALLGLDEPGRVVLLVGDYADAAEVLAQMTGAICVTLNATPAVHACDVADHIVSDSVTWIPLPDVSIDAMAVDAAHEALLTDAVRVLRRGGRLLASTHAVVPTGCMLLAQDDSEWVAQVDTTVVSSPVALRVNRDHGSRDHEKGDHARPR